MSTTCVSTKVSLGRISQGNRDSESEEISLENNKRLLKRFSVYIIFPIVFMPIIHFHMFC